ncbi:hypothetical protein OG871_32340 [Kitasatospora sp. NBC_00374]|uniref:hypothetical protein n=1 Tax=Kitasatospora sp. NBC_00374 TaxID=2975964 RepID=UPI0030E1B771
MRRSNGGLTLPRLAGWLLADILLMLVVVVLGTEVVPALPSAGRSPGPNPSAAAAAPPAGPHGASSASLDPHSESVVAHVDPDALLDGSPAAVADLLQQLRLGIQPYRARRAALVLVWGSAAACRGCAADLGRSAELARQVAPRVPDVAPEFFPAYDPRIIRAYEDGEGQVGTVRLELFFVRG